MEIWILFWIRIKGEEFTLSNSQASIKSQIKVLALEFLRNFNHHFRSPCSFLSTTFMGERKVLRILKNFSWFLNKKSKGLIERRELNFQVWCICFFRSLPELNKGLYHIRFPKPPILRVIFSKIRIGAVFATIPFSYSEIES